MLIALISILPLAVFAQDSEDTQTTEESTTGEDIVVTPLEEGETEMSSTEEETVALETGEDVFLGDDTVDYSKDVEGDLVAAGGTVTVRGEIKGDMVLTGGIINVENTVGGNLVVAGGTININGEVMGKVVAFGGMININADVHEDIYAFGGAVNLNGEFGDDVRVGAGTLTLTGTIADELKANVTEFDKDTDATIGGEESVTIVEGKKADVTIDTESLRDMFKSFTIMALLQKVISTLGWIVVAILVIKLCPTQTKNMMQKLEKGDNWFIGFGVGLVTFIVTPIIAIILAISMIGLPLIAIGIPALTLAMLISMLLMKTWVGYRILVIFGNKNPTYNASAATGVISIMLLSLVPVLGSLLRMILVTSAFGIYAQTMWNKYSERKS